ncbi:MAG: kelch repeat-containing protein, partial [Verrucomicrobiota bacterium]
MNLTACLLPGLACSLLLRIQAQAPFLLQGNVLLYDRDPFSSEDAQLLGGIQVLDWTSAPSGLPGSLVVIAERAGASGLGVVSNLTVSPLPAGTSYALVNQLASDISLYNYTGTAGLSRDADGNGLNDAWEQRYGLHEPGADADQDGFSNKQEHDAGTDPLDPASHPAADCAAAQWTLRSTSGPPPRSGLTLAYHQAEGVTYLFGGTSRTNSTDPGTVFNDLWTWNGTDWTQQMAASVTNGWLKSPEAGWQPSYAERPVQRFRHGLVYDSLRHRLVLFGGETRTPEGQQLFLNDLWEWDGHAWLFRTAAGPAPRVNHGMAFDPARGVTVVYGGFINAPSPQLAAVWEWDGNQWRNIVLTTGPNANYSQDIGSMVYDHSRRLVAFGPTIETSGNWTFWSWDGRAWSNLFDAYSAPFFRLEYGRIASDAGCGRLLYFGGKSGAGPVRVTGSFDATGWNALTNLDVTPPSRFEHALAYDAARGTVVMFGGEGVDLRGSAVFHGDTWEFGGLAAPPVQPRIEQFHFS